MFFFFYAWAITWLIEGHNFFLYVASKEGKRSCKTYTTLYVYVCLRTKVDIDYLFLLLFTLFFFKIHYHTEIRIQKDMKISKFHGVHNSRNVVV